MFWVILIFALVIWGIIRLIDNDWDAKKLDIKARSLRTTQIELDASDDVVLKMRDGNS